MLIVSQDKRHIVNLDNVRLMYCYGKVGDAKTHVRVEFNARLDLRGVSLHDLHEGDDTWIVATYGTRAEAEDALAGIAKAYSDGDRVHVMPAEDDDVRVIYCG